MTPPDEVLRALPVAGYRAWLRRIAIAQASRDRQRGWTGASARDYMRKMHASVRAHHGRCAHTGMPMRWDLIGVYDSELARGGGEYCARFEHLPSVDHLTDGPPAQLAVCAWWFNRAKGSASVDATLQNFDCALQARAAARDWNRQRQLECSGGDADRWLSGSRLCEWPPMEAMADVCTLHELAAAATACDQASRGCQPPESEEPATSTHGSTTPHVVACSHPRRAVAHGDAQVDRAAFDRWLNESATDGPREKKARRKPGKRERERQQRAHVTPRARVSFAGLQVPNWPEPEPARPVAARRAKRAAAKSAKRQAGAARQRGGGKLAFARAAAAAPALRVSRIICCYRPPFAMPDNFLFETPLDQLDADANRMIMLERRRQAQKLILIASESICPKPVREAVAGELANIYAEGYPSTRMSVWERGDVSDIDRHLAFFRRYADRRYYKGTEFCDFISTLAMERAAALFTRFDARGVRADDVHVNVQPLSGAAANNAIYNATVNPGDTIMGIELSHGGHLSHGSPFNRSGQVYNVIAYHTDKKTGTIDYDEVIDLAKKHKPKVLVCGGSALPWALDFEALRRAADAAGALLLADMAHPAGLIVAGEYPNPISYADIVMTTTHKTLCGPRGAIIVTTNDRLADKIDMGVFPGEQGGPHMQAIAGKAVAFGIALRDEFVQLMKNVKANSATFADEMVKQGFNLVGGGTNTHLFLLDCKKVPGVKGNLNGDIASRVLDLVGITLNKNTVAGDTSAANPSGLRIGSTWISQLGFGEQSTRELAQTMGDVLKAMRPFDVLGAFGYLGRARLPLEAMQSAKQRISGLIARHPWPEIQARVRKDEAALFNISTNVLAEPPADFGNADAELAASKEGAALIDVTRAGLFEVRGERALHFLQLLSTADVSRLEAGHGLDTFFLDADGRMIAPASIWRDSAWDRQRSTGWQRRYWVQVPGATRAAVAEWFRGHTDGYMLFEQDDLHAKIDGPVVVLDRREPLSSQCGVPVLYSFALVGPKAADVLKKALPGAPELAANSCGGINGTSIGLSRGGFGGETSIELHMTGADALATWKALTEAGATAAGMTTTAALYGRTGLPAPGTPATELRAKFADTFHASSTWFVGSRAAVTAEGKQPLADFSWTDHDEHDDAKLKKSCLYDEHVKLKGVMVPFAGWKMPVKYAGAISEEHRAVRTRCGLFDVSHMGVFEFRGPGAQRFLDQVTSNYVTKLRKGEAHYSYLLDANGGCIDDIFVYCRDFDRYMMVVNAANADKDWDWITGLNDGRYIIDPARPWARADGGDGLVKIVNLKEDESEGDRRRVDLALQGKSSYKVLRSMADRVTAKAITDLPRTHFMECTLEGIDVIIAKTGYTGEPVGCELYVHPDKAPEFWQKLLARHDDHGIEAVGLGARDSTRTEAGFPLYGHELAGPYNINATEAGYGSFVKRHKPFFAGRAGFLAAESKRTMEVVRFKMTHGGVRTIPTGATVVNKKGQGIGFVTSAALVGDRQIGLAWVKRQFIDEGMRIGVFIPPRKSEGAARHGYELAVGDNHAIHEEATIMSRFPKKGEFNANIGL